MEPVCSGGFALPASGLFLLLGLATFFLVTQWWEKRQKRSLEASMWVSLIIGVLVARVSFVLMYWDSYRHDLPGIFYFWQDGYFPLAGIFAALLVAMLYELRRKHSPLPVLSSMAAGLVVWFGLGFVAAQLADTHELPDLVLADLQQESVTLQDYQDRPIVINLWATWCPPCRREMPAFQDAQRANEDVHFLFVNQLETNETIQAFLDKEELEMDNILLDSDGRVAGHFGTRGMPTTLFFDTEGRMLDIHVGELSRAQIQHYLNQLDN